MSSAADNFDPAWAAENKGPRNIIICWVVTALSTVFVFGRLYIRSSLHKRLLYDDYFIIIAIICGYLSTALTTVAVHYGDGRHFETLTIDQKGNVIFYVTVAFAPGILSFGVPKLAVIALLTRLLNPHPWHKTFLWALGILAVCSLITTVGLLLGQCRPMYGLWDLTVTDKFCYDKTIVMDQSFYAGALSAFVDLYLAVYPALTLFHLQLPLKKKVALSITLGFGTIAAVVAVYKTSQLTELASPDFSYDTSDLGIWTVLEGSVLMIASSIPILQPLLDKITKRSWFSSQKSSKNRSKRSLDTVAQSNMSYQNEVGSKKRNSERRLYPNLDITYHTRGDSSDETLSDDGIMLTHPMPENVYIPEYRKRTYEKTQNGIRLPDTTYHAV